MARAGTNKRMGDQSFLRDIVTWTVVSVIAGVFGGTFVVLLDKGLAECAAWRHQVPFGLIWVTPAVGSLLVGLALWRLGREAEGEPMPKYIHAVTRFSGRIPFAHGAAALLGSFVTLGSGGSGGTTGPAVLSSAYLATALSDRIGGLRRILHMKEEGRSTFAISAAAAAISAILRVPIGGGIMAVELLFRRNLEYDRLFSAILSSVSGYLVYIALGGSSEPLLAHPGATLPGIELTPYVFGLIIAVEIMSKGFVWTYQKTHRLLSRLQLAAPVRLGLGGLCVGLMALALGALNPDGGRELLGTSRDFMLNIVGSGSYAGHAGTVTVSLAFVAVFLVAKLLATTVTVGSGNIAGFVMPTVLLGAFGGHLMASLAGWTPTGNPTAHGALLATGIAAAIGATLNCPLAGMIIVTELFGLPFAWVAAIGALIAYRISPETAVYNLDLEADRILVVDDEKPMRGLLTNVLTQAGHVVDAVASGEAALEAIGRERYDLVLLDRNMPGMSGDDVLKRLRSSPATERLTVILLTAKDKVEERVEGLHLGADDYITKPFHVPELQARVAQALRRAHQAHTAILPRG